MESCYAWRKRCGSCVLAIAVVTGLSVGVAGCGSGKTAGGPKVLQQSVLSSPIKVPTRLGDMYVTTAAPLPTREGLTVVYFSQTEMRSHLIDWVLQRESLRKGSDMIVAGQEIPTLVYAPNGKRLIAAYRDGGYVLVSGPFMIKSDSGYSTTFRFSPDSNVIAAGWQDLTLLTIARLRITATTFHRAVASPEESDPESGSPVDISSIWFRSDQDVLAATPQALYEWSANRGPMLHLLFACACGGSNTAFSGNGKTLAIGTKDGHVLLYEIASRRLLWDVAAVAGMGDHVYELAFTRGDRYLVAGTSAGWIAVFDVAKGRVVERMQIDTEPIIMLQTSDDGRLVVIGTQTHFTLEQPPDGRPRMNKIEIRRVLS